MIRKPAFTLAEVLIAKRERGKMSLLIFPRTRELKAPTNRFLKQCAFTLAEVLITLGIIGIVAAMTIPSLIQSYQEKQTVTSLKKVFTTLSQAYTLAVQENGNPSEWGMATDYKSILTKLMPYLRVDKDCTDASSGCFPPGESYIWLRGGGEDVLDSRGEPRIRLVDGTLILGFVNSASCANVSGTSQALSHACGRYWVDVNGNKKPNQWGKDVFNFWLTDYGIVAGGSADADQYAFDNECQDRSTMRGIGCAAWVIYNENMDYLKCSDLSWAGKKKCG